MPAQSSDKCRNLLVFGIYLLQMLGTHLSHYSLGAGEYFLQKDKLFSTRSRWLALSCADRFQERRKWMFDYAVLLLKLLYYWIVRVNLLNFDPALKPTSLLGRGLRRKTRISRLFVLEMEMRIVRCLFRTIEAKLAKWEIVYIGLLSRQFILFSRICRSYLSALLFLA